MTQPTHPLHELTGPACGRLFEALRSGPDSGVHVRELARGAGLSLSSLQRELDRLSSLGVVKRTSRSNRVVHSLRHQEPFVKLFLAAIAALELRGTQLNGMPSDRDAERTFVELCAHFPPDAELWRQFGDPGFLAGVAVTLAGHSGFERAAYLALAESLCPGSSAFEPHVAWHQAHRPNLARFFSMVDRERRTYARTGY